MARTADSVILRSLAPWSPANYRLVAMSGARADISVSDVSGAGVPDDPEELDRLLAPVLGHPLLRALPSNPN